MGVTGEKSFLREEPGLPGIVPMAKAFSSHRGLLLSIFAQTRVSSFLASSSPIKAIVGLLQAREDRVIWAKEQVQSSFLAGS